MRKILEKYKSVIWFSLLKYLEIGITAATTFMVAKKIGPSQMGKSIPVLLFVTYTSYLAVGINQVIVKNYSRFTDKQMIFDFVKINFQYFIIISLITALIAYVVIDPAFFISAALIGAASLLRTFFMSYYRATDKVWILNKNNLIFSALLFLFTLFCVNTLNDYFKYWSIAYWVAVVFYFIDGRTFFITIIKKIHLLPTKEDFIYNIKEGAKLASAGFIATILLTADRFVINKLNIDVKIKGSYQLADYAAMAYYLVVTTVIFYFYPKLIAKLRDNVAYRTTYINLLKLILKFVPLLFVIIFLLGKVVALLIFPEYAYLEYFIILSVSMKTGVALLTALSMYYIALDKEIVYIKSMRFVVAAYATISLVFIYVYQPPIFYIPASFSLVLLLDLLYKLINFEKKNQFNS